MSVVILRDTGSIQTLMIGDPKSLPAESNTRKSVSVRGVNGGVRSVPLYKVNCFLMWFQEKWLLVSYQVFE